MTPTDFLQLAPSPLCSSLLPCTPPLSPVRLPCLIVDLFVFFFHVIVLLLLFGGSFPRAQRRGAVLSRHFYWIFPSKACWKACPSRPLPCLLSLSSLGSGPDGQGPKPNWAICYLMIMYSSSKPLANHLPRSQSWPRDKTSPRAHNIVLAILAH